ncbi:hypothetical protein K435DRAFT_732838 [Dendrothele bispora CBS 962.96]|uniref:P/Homo B domain-containing protein n=1 Tax=Dendrothele bispora (strain CBS 962.96) TaxID=1314807 RepID=A0A4S8L8B3_DENBC|nr:hypothetical protein K435DRAFT_732838 [Dendrothele bispora CBS 962.96]
MRIRLLWSIFLLLPLPILSSSVHIKRAHHSHNYYVLEHDPLVAGIPLDAVTEVLGVELVEPVKNLRNFWLVRAEKQSVSTRTEGSTDPVLARYNRLRSNAHPSTTGFTERSQDHALANSIKYLSRQTLRQRAKRAPPPIASTVFESASQVAERLAISDPLFGEQWHLVNEEYPENTMNVTGVWEMGITGKGVISSLIDDGLDYTSDDLAENFDAAASHDYNDHTDLPTPKLSDDTHGTRCAGQIAAVRNNLCGVGIAYDSKVAGVRILSGPISDVDEAEALNYAYQDVSIYSCSWGPPDDGRTMEGPDYLIRKAMLEGINNGRDGKGSVFVFASGNGAASGDQCNFDGYTNSIYSVTVSAIDYKHVHPYYSEPCAANMVVAYSSGSGKSIVTTDRGDNKCTSRHGGTSAAAPNAVGVFALALQVRPDLTWRDIQHLCVRTARMINEDEDEWENTAAGRKYNYKYGYGVLDGYRFVTAAQEWELVKPQAWFKTPTVILENGKMTEDWVYSGGQFITEEGITSTITVTQEMLQNHNFEKLEHINVKVWINHARRGDVEVEVVSPNGIKSVLAGQRRNDKADTGFPGWTFMSVKHWDEDPVGDWTIRVTDAVNSDTNGTFLGWNIMFWGSAVDPAQVKKFELVSEKDVFPPPEEAPEPPKPSPTTTRTYQRPTVHPETSAETSPTSSPDSEVSTSSFPGLAKLVSNQKAFFGAIGAVAVFGIGMAVFFWRRRVRARQQNYTSLVGEDVGMTMAGDRTGTRELYDAFGEDSDEDAGDEQTLLPKSGLPDNGAHYRDEPDEQDGRGSRNRERDDVDSNLSGSWEHASP